MSFDTVLEVVEPFLANFYIKLIIRTVIIVVFFLALKKVSKSYLEKWSSKIIKSGEPVQSRRNKRTRIALLNSMISAILVIVAFLLVLMGIPALKAFSYSLLASAGILAVVIGFAMQKTLSNVLSGVFLALYEPFRVGDKIKIFDDFGEIEDLTLRHTIIKTWDNRRLVIPNSVIDEKEIVNYSIKDEKVLWTINMGISYDSSIDRARKIMVDLAKKHPNNLWLKNKKPEFAPFVRVTECGDFAVNLRLYFWCEDAWISWRTGHDLTEAIKKEFDKKGIEIPFPYRTVVYKKDMERKKKSRKR
jgi:small-conductance mechanosensitive channel